MMLRRQHCANAELGWRPRSLSCSAVAGCPSSELRELLLPDLSLFWNVEGCIGERWLACIATG